jgi:hypothetical protein
MRTCPFLPIGRKAWHVSPTPGAVGCGRRSPEHLEGSLPDACEGDQPIRIRPGWMQAKSVCAGRSGNSRGGVGTVCREEGSGLGPSINRHPPTPATPSAWVLAGVPSRMVVCCARVRYRHSPRPPGHTGPAATAVLSLVSLRMLAHRGESEYRGTPGFSRSAPAATGRASVAPKVEHEESRQ